MTNSRALCAVPLFLILAAGCGGDDTGPTGPEAEAARPTSISVSASAVALAIGEEAQLSAEVKDQSAVAMAGVSVTWASGKTSVATVSSTGLVTAVARGTGFITATSGTLTATVEVTVTVNALGEYSLQTDFGSLDQNDVRVDGIFAVWWDEDYDLEADALLLLEMLAAIGVDAVNEVGMTDPPNPAAGYYVNIYIHIPGAGNDNYPDWWGNGVGTDSNSLPYMTLPLGAHNDLLNVRHEGFHIFQWGAPGFPYSGDSQWYVEATAQWFAVTGAPDVPHAFIEAGAITANPQQALWHSFENEAPGDPINWNRQVRQYGMHTYLYYLTEVVGVAPNVLVDGFYDAASGLPQEYHFTHIENLRSHFADWAAHNTADMDYISRDQWELAVAELGNSGDANDVHPFVASYVNTGTEGVWVGPESALAPRGWAYNVFQITNAAAATYTFELDGDETGSEAAAASFDGRVVVVNDGGNSFHSLSMTNDQDGVLSVEVGVDDGEIYLIVVSVPQHFSGNQTYSYRVRISRN